MRAYLSAIYRQNTKQRKFKEISSVLCKKVMSLRIKDSPRHVEKMNEERGPVKAQQLQLIGSKKGRPKKELKEVLAKDINIRGLTQLQ